MASVGEGGRDVTEIRAALATIMSRYNDLPSLIQENTREAWREVAVNEVRQEALRQGVAVEEVARGAVVRQIRSLALQSQSGDVRGLLSTVGELVRSGVVDGGVLGETLLREPLLLSLPLHTLWKFSRTRVVSMEQIILRLHRERSTEHVISLVSELLDLCLYCTTTTANSTAPHHRRQAAAVVRDVLAALVSMAHDSVIPQQARHSTLPQRPPTVATHSHTPRSSSLGPTTLHNSPTMAKEPSKYSVDHSKLSLNPSLYSTDLPTPLPTPVASSSLWGLQGQEEDYYDQLRVYAGEVLRSLTEGLVSYILENNAQIYIPKEEEEEEEERGGAHETRKEGDRNSETRSESDGETRSTRPPPEKKCRTDREKHNYTLTNTSNNSKDGARKKNTHTRETRREGHGIGPRTNTNTANTEAQTQAQTQAQQGPPTVTNIYALLTNCLSVGKQALIDYCSSQLVQILTHSPDLELALVLTRQDVWRSTHTNTALASMLRKLVVVVGLTSSVETLERVVGNEEVNWGCVLTLVATLVTSHHAAVPLLKDTIERNIRRGCDDREMESLVVGLLFARHASQEGPHVFPSYAQWFGALFSTEAASPVADKQAFVFMVRFLTNLVPHEPDYCLRAHLTTHIFTPRGCQEILQEYKHIARARLQELRDNQDTTSASLPTSAAKSKAVIEEVKSAVRQYQETTRIPNQVLEAAVFREAHFRTSFLPTLLTPRPLPATPDARSQLITALHKRGKVTTTMMQRYTHACQHEATQLLAGVFEGSEDDVIMEEPITELTHMLDQLTKAWENLETTREGGNGMRSEGGNGMRSEGGNGMRSEGGNGMRSEGGNGTGSKTRNESRSETRNESRSEMRNESRSETRNESRSETRNESRSEARGESRSEARGESTILPILSRVSHKLEDMTRTVDAQLKTEAVETLSVDVRAFDDRLQAYQITTQGLVLFELSVVEGVFLPVTLSSQPQQQQQQQQHESFTTLYLQQLNLSTPLAQHFACSVLSEWLHWHITSTEESIAEKKKKEKEEEEEEEEEEENNHTSLILSTLPPHLTHLYLCLAPRIPVVFCPRDDESEVSVSDVYNYLQGHSGVGVGVGGVPECSRLYYSTLFQQGYTKIPVGVWVRFELEADWGDTAINCVSLSSTFLLPQRQQAATVGTTAYYTHGSSLGREGERGSGKNWEEKRGSRKDWEEKRGSRKDWEEKRGSRKEWEEKRGSRKDWEEKRGSRKDWEEKRGSRKEWEEKRGSRKNEEMEWKDTEEEEEEGRRRNRQKREEEQEEEEERWNRKKKKEEEEEEEEERWKRKKKNNDDDEKETMIKINTKDTTTTATTTDDDKDKWSLLLKSAEGSWEYLKTLLSYLGIQQANGNVPLFLHHSSSPPPPHLLTSPPPPPPPPLTYTHPQTSAASAFVQQQQQHTPRNHSLSDKNLRVVRESVCQLRRLTGTDRAGRLPTDLLLLPGNQDEPTRNLAGKLVMDNHTPMQSGGGVGGGVGGGIKPYPYSRLTSPRPTSSSSSTSPRPTSSSSSFSASSDLDYLSELSREVMDVIGRLGREVLSRVPKSTLVRCDSEVRAAVYLGLQGTDKR
ncbi:hypothetical protein Pmani_008081 [Petrolisthes manimaculis]|uniref:Uncharacterized protein n=1 Tax=Petrolisthes manimaculis TaxID=1843537 RepID=A0AAE1Q9D5_9EUCA|nr:hypothetical protein Pmani_008081 [Petrolisthes manimaculis]